MSWLFWFVIIVLQNRTWDSQSFYNSVKTQLRKNDKIQTDKMQKWQNTKKPEYIQDKIKKRQKANARKCKWNKIQKHKTVMRQTFIIKLLKELNIKVLEFFHEIHEHIFWQIRSPLLYGKIAFEGHFKDLISIKFIINPWLLWLSNYTRPSESARHQSKSTSLNFSTKHFHFKSIISL